MRVGVWEEKGRNVDELGKERGVSDWLGGCDRVVVMRDTLGRNCTRVLSGAADLVCRGFKRGGRLGGWRMQRYITICASTIIPTRRELCWRTKEGE